MTATARTAAARTLTRYRLAWLSHLERATGRPMSILLTPGQAGDNPQLLALLDAIRVNGPAPDGPANAPRC